MSLVVARIHGQGLISFVSDTKVTWPDPARTADTYANGLAKIVIVRPDLAVGVTGFDPHARIRDLMAMRDASVGELLGELKMDSHAGFVVAELDPAELWTVGDGAITNRTRFSVAAEGDPVAYDQFRERYERDWADDTSVDVPFRMMTAMQALTSFDRVPLVGGATLRALGEPEVGFRFVGDRMWSADGRELIYFVGAGATPGAIGFLDRNRDVGYLFRHESPDLAVDIETSDPDEFVRISLTSHNQTVGYSAWRSGSRAQA